MNKKLIVSITFLLIIFILPQAVFGCIYEARVKLVAYQSDVDRLGEKSNYQIEGGFREFDNLLLNELYLIAYGDCNNESIAVDITLETPTGKKIALVPSQYIQFISKLKDNEEYRFNCSSHIENSADYFCMDSYNNNFTLKAVRIPEAGLWTGNINILDEKSGKITPANGNTIIFPSKKVNMYYLAPFEFLVISRAETISLDLTKSNNDLAWIAILIAIGAIIFEAALYLLDRQLKSNDNREKQEMLLQSILITIKEIKDNAKGHEEELTKKKIVIPSYLLTPLPETYFINLDSKIKSKETKKLKENLVRLQNKIENVNSMIKLLQQGYILHSKKNNFEQLKHEILRKVIKGEELKINFEKDKPYIFSLVYYIDLITITNRIEEEINKLNSTKLGELFNPIKNA